jgi:sulfite exporter TauE/SafE
MNKVIFSFFLLGLSLGSGPCLVTCGPLIIAYIAGTRKNIILSIWAYLLFSLSRVFVYALLGLSVFLSGQLISQHIFGSLSRYIFIFAGIFIMLVGLAVAFGKNPDYRFCQRLQGFFLKKDAKTIIVFGLIIAIIPCLPFISLLSYIGLVSKNWLDSLRYSLAFGAGTIVSPLFILSTLSGLIPKIITGNNKFYIIFNSICGLVIIFLGIQLIIRAFV